MEIELEVLIPLAMLLMLVAYLVSGTVIFVSILIVSALSLVVFLGFDANRLGATLTRVLIRASNSWELSAIPLFIWMGEIVLLTPMINNLFRGLSIFIGRLPGGLLHTNVFGCAMFAAVSGSSAATTATVGKITLQELRKRNYDDNLSIGSLAGAGTLGLLIPPSIVMIIYGLLAEVSIVRLFAAGLLPGLLIAFLYSSYIGANSLANPKTAPQAPQKMTASSLFEACKLLLPILVLIGVVLGSLYSGWATPSESAAVGVLCALLLGALYGKFNWKIIIESLQNAVPTACMVCSILIAASFLSTTMGFLHIPQNIAELIGGLELSKYSLILTLAIFYIFLGLLLDGISITVMTLPITMPLVYAAGIDPIWFGVFLVIMVELGQITPPVGFNLFVIQGISGHSILKVARAAMPFFFLMCFALVVLTLIPQIALWLPEFLYS